MDPESGEVIAEASQRLDAETARQVIEIAPKGLQLAVLHPLVDHTLDRDPTHTEEEALIDIYKRERPGDPVTPEIARNRLSSLFADNRRYDLARVGRYKLNKKLGLSLPESVRTLTKEDVIAILRYLIRLSEDEDAATVDEIDHLMNKRVRSVGELLQNQFRIGFLRMERICRERMTSLDPEQVTPQSIVSTKPISAAIKSFFGSSQLSQFMDETNPLAELTHKRRLSALGPGGLSRQSAKLEVRDVHHSHYGRICPIETPEGPNIGLIGSLAIYARLDEYGFIETPYRRVKDGVVKDEIVYLTADEEDAYRIAPASVPTDEKGKIMGDLVNVRFRESYPQVPPTEIEFADLSPKQIVSVAACLIPFLENDDTNRALMGSNMQRQAVPLVVPEAAYVRTGVEGRAAQDSGAVILARADGMVTLSQADRIEVTRLDGIVDLYRLQKFVRSNQATCINQRPIVRHGQFVAEGEVLADGPSTDKGNLALGRNILVAFMPWEGYNYEDAIVLSERLVRDDVFTSIHIEKYEVEARDTKVGPEEVTRDIPNVGDEALKDLDEDGVIRIGAQVRAEDILVGKVAPKGQEELTSEEKLVRAIFGEKAAEMRDTSLRVPHGEKGKVVDIKRFSRLKFRCQKCDTEYQVGKNQHRHYCDRCGGELKREPGDELLPGVNQLVRVLRGAAAQDHGRRQARRTPRQQGRRLQDPAGRGHALHAGRQARGHGAQPARRAFPSEHRADSGNPHGSGGQGVGRGLREPHLRRRHRQGDSELLQGGRGALPPAGLAEVRGGRYPAGRRLVRSRGGVRSAEGGADPLPRAGRSGQPRARGGLGGRRAERLGGDPWRRGARQVRGRAHRHPRGGPRRLRSGHRQVLAVRRSHRRALQPADHGGRDLHHEADPPGGRQDPRRGPRDLTLW